MDTTPSQSTVSDRRRVQRPRYVPMKHLRWLLDSQLRLQQVNELREQNADKQIEINRLRQEVSKLQNIMSELLQILAGQNRRTNKKRK